MGIEPIYSGSAGRRLDDSAAPACSPNTRKEDNKNIVAKVSASTLCLECLV